jgi:hypothetical protein
VAHFYRLVQLGIEPFRGIRGFSVVGGFSELGADEPQRDGSDKATRNACSACRTSFRHTQTESRSSQLAVFAVFVPEVQRSFGECC